MDAADVDIERSATKPRGVNNKSISKPEMSGKISKYFLCLESRLSDEMPVLRYERNTKLDVNLHPQRHEESYQSAEIEQE